MKCKESFCPPVSLTWLSLLLAAGFYCIFGLSLVGILWCLLTSNPKCKGRCKLLTVSTMANIKAWTKCTEKCILLISAHVWRLAPCLLFLPLFRLLSSKAGGGLNRKGVWERVCKKAGDNALCFAQQMHYHGPADGDWEKKAIEQSSTTPSHPRLIIFSLHSHLFFLSSSSHFSISISYLSLSALLTSL